MIRHSAGYFRLFSPRHPHHTHLALRILSPHKSCFLKLPRKKKAPTQTWRLCPVERVKRWRQNDYFFIFYLFFNSFSHAELRQRSPWKFDSLPQCISDYPWATAVWRLAVTKCFSSLGSLNGVWQQVLLIHDCLYEFAEKMTGVFFVVSHLATYEITTSAGIASVAAFLKVFPQAWGQPSLATLCQAVMTCFHCSLTAEESCLGISQPAALCPVCVAALQRKLFFKVCAAFWTFVAFSFESVWFGEWFHSCVPVCSFTYEPEFTVCSTLSCVLFLLLPLHIKSFPLESRLEAFIVKK